MAVGPFTKISIRSFNGIGDLLFITPSLRVIKEAYPESHITINTGHFEMLQNNPFVDVVSASIQGLFLPYPDPHAGKPPTKHHIISVWELICNRYCLETDRPELKPEIYFPISDRGNLDIGVQVLHKGQWGGKKIWPGFLELCERDGFHPIPKLKTQGELIKHIANCKAVVCAEGAVNHIAQALNVPCVVVYGGWSIPKWNGYKEQTNVTIEAACSPCYNRQPCRFNKACYRMISVDMVQNKALQLIGVSNAA